MKRQNNVITAFAIAVTILFPGANAFCGDLEDGHKFFLRQRYNEAIQKYEAALADAKDDEAANIHFYIGRAYEMKNWWRKAMAEFDKIITDYPKHPILAEATVEFGQCCVRLQQMDEALDIFEKSSKTFEDPWIRASSLLNKAILQCSSNKNVFNIEKAMDSLNGIINDYKFDDLRVKAWYWLGYTYNLQQKYEEAIAAWDNVIHEGPETLWAELVPGYIFIARQKLGQPDAAKDLNAKFANNARMTRTIGLFGQFTQNQNAGGQIFYFNPMSNQDKEKKLQLVEIRLVNQGKVIYQYFIQAKSFNYENDKGIISINGNVRITDKLKNPLFILEASDASIQVENSLAVANGSVNFILKEEKEKGVAQEMKNIPNMDIDLRTREFNVNRSEQ